MRSGREYIVNGKTSRVYYAERKDDIFEYVTAYGANSFFVIDENVAHLFPTKDLPPYYVLVDWKDSDKTMENVEWLISEAARQNCRKSDRWVGVGGGVVMDMTTFASSLYLGGVPLSLVPTTLIAMTDAAIGGRGNLNIPEGRHYIETLYPADEIIIDALFIKYLPVYEVRNGLGEMIKHALLSLDEGLMNELLWLRNRKDLSFNTLTKVMELSVNVKLDYIEAAQSDPSIMKFLELGHNLSWIHEEEGVRSHGECTVWGIGMAIRLGMQMGITKREVYDKALALITGYRYDVKSRFGRSEVENYRVEVGPDGKESVIDDFDIVLLRDRGEPFMSRISFDTFLRFST